MSEPNTDMLHQPHKMTQFSENVREVASQCDAVGYSPRAATCSFSCGLHTAVTDTQLPLNIEHDAIYLRLHNQRDDVSAKQSCVETKRLNPVGAIAPLYATLSRQLIFIKGLDKLRQI